MGPGGGTVAGPSGAPSGLAILTAGDAAGIEPAVRARGGRIVAHVAATGTYTVAFPGATADDLVRLRDELRREGLDARLVTVLPTP